MAVQIHFTEGSWGQGRSPEAPSPPPVTGREGLKSGQQGELLLCYQTCWGTLMYVYDTQRILDLEEIFLIQLGSPCSLDGEPETHGLFALMGYTERPCHKQTNRGPHTNGIICYPVFCRFTWHFPGSSTLKIGRLFSLWWWQ